MADGADPLLGFGLDQLLHHHPDRRAAQIHASPGGLAHLRGDWVGKEIGALNPFGGTTPARSRAVGESTTPRSMSKSKQSVTAVRHSRRVTLAPPARLASKELLMRWSVFKIGVNNPHSLDRDDVFGGRAPWIAASQTETASAPLGSQTPVPRTSRRTRGTTT